MADCRDWQADGGPRDDEAAVVDVLHKATPGRIGPNRGGDFSVGEERVADRSASPSAKSAAELPPRCLLSQLPGVRHHEDLAHGRTLRAGNSDPQPRLDR